ncbi:MAG TPA: hypothetical protein VGO87_07495 [Acidimicrobiia bacterium]
MIFEAGFWTGVHPATVGLAVAMVVLVVLVEFILSPAGRPTPRRHRAGGFSRAIADRTDGQGGDL